MRREEGPCGESYQSEQPVASRQLISLRSIRNRHYIGKKHLKGENTKQNYCPPEVRRGEYWGLGIFLLQYFPLVNIWKCCIDMNQLW